jgi:uncharacterized protein YihD (DUF1040 family)
MFGLGFGQYESREVTQLFEKIGRKFAEGNQILLSDLTDVSLFRKQLDDLRTDIRILQNEMREIQRAASSAAK